MKNLKLKPALNLALNLRVLLGALALLVSANAFANLGDLDKQTFPCPAAALNAAAREAGKVSTQGTYEFISYKLVNESGSYEVSFRSNVEREPVLNYTVTLYCQQGWDPNATVKVIRH
jgi:hypothetical protein